MNERDNLMFEFWTRFNSAHNALLRAQFKHIQKSNLTVPQFHVMLVTYFNGPTSLKKISELLSVTNANITCVVHNLIKIGALKTETSRIDRRIVNADLTPKGKELVENILPDFNLAFKNVLSKLDDKEKEQLNSILIKI